MKSLVNNLRVAALPMPIVWADKEANMRIVEQAFARLPQGTDLVVLPELFSTGFADDFELIADLAERNTGPTIDRVKSWGSALWCGYRRKLYSLDAAASLQSWFFYRAVG